MDNNKAMVLTFLIIALIVIVAVIAGTICSFSENIKSVVKTENGITYIYETDDGNITVKGNGNSVVYEY